MLLHPVAGKRDAGLGTPAGQKKKKKKKAGRDERPAPFQHINDFDI